MILTEDIQIAANEVRARRGAYFPFVTLGAGAGLEKPSLFTPAGAVEDQLNVLPGKGFPEPLPDFLTAANLTWKSTFGGSCGTPGMPPRCAYLGTAEGRNYMVTL
ncbi:MAG: hypothetical protein R3C56_38470 [Pirellulaceae bacterium]